MKTGTTWLLIAFATLVSAAALQGDPLGCNLTAYKGTPGLTAAMAANVLTVTWDGDRNQEVRVRLDVTRGTPTFEVIEVRHKGGTWGRLASNVTPDFRVGGGFAPDEQSADESAAWARRCAHTGDTGQVPLGAVLGRPAGLESVFRPGRQSAAG